MRLLVPPASLSREVTSAGLIAILATLVLLGLAHATRVAEARPAGGAPVAGTADGHILLDGQPFFMIGSWGQCAGDVERNLELGVNVFVTSLCDEHALADRIDGRAWMIQSISTAETLSPSIGFLQPDEPDVHGIPASRLEAPRGNGKLTILDVSMDFWDGAQRPDVDYPALFKKGDVLSTNVYPIELNCNREPWVTIETTYDVQLQLAALGKPSGQWLEVNRIDDFCGYGLTPAIVQAEAWLAVEGGASWIGWFFPEGGHGGYHTFEATPPIADAVGKVNAQLQSYAPVLLAPRLPIRTPWGNGQPTGPGSNPVKVGGRAYRGRYYLFATNSTRSGVSWRRALPELDERAIVRRESGGGDLHAGRGGVVADTFGPLETKIYSWVPTGPAVTRPAASTVMIVLGSEQPSLSTTALAPGKVTFVVTNRGKKAHAFAVTGVGVSRRTPAIRPGKSATLTVTLKRGSYRFWDPITGTLGRAVHGRVEPADAA